MNIGTQQAAQRRPSSAGAATSGRTPEPGAASLTELRSLLACEVLELYHDNPFRVLNIATDATAVQAQKRIQKLNVMRSMGEAVVDEFAVRQAMQVLRDPHRRLVAEFFWFHIDDADPAESANVAALIHVRANRWAEARDLWMGEWKSNPSGTSGRRALHNLAVLLHVRVVTIEAGKKPLIRTMTGNHPLPPELLQSWRSAFKAWSTYWNDEWAWEHWRERARSLGDRRLAGTFVDELRDLLPETLLQINRDLARHYADAGFGLPAAQHCQIMQGSGFKPEASALLCRSVVDSVKKRLLQACEAFKQQLADSKSVTGRFCEAFEVATRGDLLVLNQLDPQRRFGSAAGREAVARTLREAARKLAENRVFITSLSLIDKAVALADSAVLRDDLQETHGFILYLRNVWARASATCLCCPQAPSAFTVLTRGKTGDSRLAFLCPAHADDKRKPEVFKKAGSCWVTLPPQPGRWRPKLDKPNFD